MQFMVLHVKGNIIQDEKVHVFMTFYANSYINDVLHSDTNKLWLPGRKDTLYIKAKAAQANQILDSAFAATEPAVLKSKSSFVSVKKEPVPDDETAF